VIHRGLYYPLADPGERGDFAAWAFVAADGGQALLNLVVTRTHANTHGILLRLRGLDPGARYRLAELIVEGCEQPDGEYLCGTGLEGRVFTGAGLMYAGLTLPPMRGDYPGVQVLLERMDAEAL